MAPALSLFLPQIHFSPQRVFVSARYGDPAGTRTPDLRLKSSKAGIFYRFIKCGYPFEQAGFEDVMAKAKRSNSAPPKERREKRKQNSSR